MSVPPIAAQARVEDLSQPELNQRPVQDKIGLAARPYKHIVVLGDPHLPGRNTAEKEAVIHTINAWPDVDLVVVLGDLCEDLGTARELDFAAAFFSRLKKPVAFIHGNHDYVYCDERDNRGHRVMGPPRLRCDKLRRFRETFGQERGYYSRRVDGYLLIFLSADDLEADSTTWLSDAQLDWWQAEMSVHRNLPTIVFCHAPLQGAVSIVREGTAAIAAGIGASLLGGPQWALPAALLCDRWVKRIEEKEMAQPHERISAIVRENPQLFMWVSGHFHVTATNRNFNSPDAVFGKQVTLIHNSCMDGWGFHSPWRGWKHDRIWTNSLFLYADKVNVKTYDHTAGCWLDKLNRTAGCR